MMAVVAITGKQYTVQPDQTFDVDHLSGEVGDQVTLKDVLLVKDGKVTKIGKPHVAGASVTVKIVAQKKGEKIDVRRFKHKVRHRRHIGFRPHLTTVQVTSIS